MDVIDALNWRYATKKFSDKKVSPEIVHKLLQATRLSASSYGLQPYKLIVVESPEIKQKLLSFSYGQQQVVDSSHLVVFAADTNVGNTTVDRYIQKHSEVVNKPVAELQRFSEHMKSALASKTPQEKQQWSCQQAYIALGNFLTCAALMQIDSCPMGGFDAAGYDSVLALSEKSLTTAVICPIGYRDDTDGQLTQPKVRFDFEEMVIEV